jgi:hypothetical protein
VNIWPARAAVFADPAWLQRLQDHLCAMNLNQPLHVEPRRYAAVGILSHPPLSRSRRFRLTRLVALDRKQQTLLPLVPFGHNLRYWPTQESLTFR